MNVYLNPPPPSQIPNQQTGKSPEYRVLSKICHCYIKILFFLILFQTGIHPIVVKSFFRKRYYGVSFTIELICIITISNNYYFDNYY